MVAQKEIAKALGVSAVTVSRALRNHPDLSQETRERILQKARDLGYPRIKSSQGRATIRRLGILLYETEPLEENQFWLSDSEIPRRILSSLQKEASRNHIETIFETARPGETPLMIQNRTVDGTIIMGRYEPDVLSHLRNLPALSVSSYIANDWLARIVVDNFRGMQTATNHLISLGHRRILFLGAEKGGWSELHRERERGYAFAMYSHGLAAEAVYCPGWHIEPVAEKILAASAIVCSSDSLALPMISLFQARGKSVPRDCSIVSFDGHTASAKFGLTTYTPDWALLGRSSVDFISNCAQNLLGNGMELIIPGKLVLRESARPA